MELLRNDYLTAENRILRAQIKGRGRTRNSARDIIETCRCRSLYIRFCYFVAKSASHHLYTF
jgi:hypothetical protein